MAEKIAPLNDAAIRSALQSKLLLDNSDDAAAVLIEELGLCRGRVRVDLAVVNGQLHGYEIKSDCDRLSRLGVQAEIYTSVFDRLTLVVGERHLEQGMGAVPTWWGVLQAKSTTSGLRFHTVRRAKKNPQRDPRSLVELLWLNEAIKLLEERATARGVRGKPRRVVWDRICDQLGIDEIAAAVRSQLKARAANQVLA